MILPDYWLARPSVELDETALAAFDELAHMSLGSGGCTTVEYDLPWPKWQFLSHIAERHEIALHGSGDPTITLFEPRQANDISDFGNQKAVYAAADGLWAMFFAIVDRERVGSISNACIRLIDQMGSVLGPYYVFSVTRSALAAGPWRTGWVYLLPRQPFKTQPPIAFGPYEVHIAQLASPQSVEPLAKLMVSPDDFPFLAAVRGHDDHRLQEYAAAMQTGAPWPDDQ